ncbi:hypothetical protein DFJ58DRAFT_854899 [Suillus subalutaceus]|uniref:uncharacterized protein n=1 Tax=Suillus subalutaceus TaxID=48586 RepID=UPI001B87310D|nr:uncharacterized protein DFJ58DRAFT_854899 [Suillus subalutaceus]KAG1842897.1 hypothetical protein DFJ58DRAFT_854899 [Suillus subalutaceus]
MIRLHEDALPLLFAERPPQSLFPSLSSLDFSILSCSSSNFTLIRDFLSPKMTNLAFTLPRKMCLQGICGVLEDLPRKATRLENLTISSSFHSIRISAQSVLNIASLRHVQELSLNLHPNFDVDILRDRANNSTFPALQRLILTAYDLPQCTSIVSLISSPQLEDVSVSYDVQAQSSVITSFLSAIGTSIRSISLRHNMRTNTIADTPFVFYPSIFAPLFACRNLRTIQVYNLGTLNLDDEFIIAAAKAWNKLEDIRLCSLPWSYIIPSVSLNALTALTQYCPQLTRVHLSLDAREIPEVPIGGLSTVGAQFLEVLNIRDSVIEHTELVAQFCGRPYRI